MTWYFVVFTDTDGLIGKDGHWANDCAKVIAGGGGEDIFTETDRLIGKKISNCGNGFAHHGLNVGEGFNASGDLSGKVIPCHVAVLDTDRLGEKNVPLHKNLGGNVGFGASVAVNSNKEVIRNVRPGILDHGDVDFKIHAEGWSHIKFLCYALLQTLSAVMEHLLNNPCSGCESLDSTYAALKDTAAKMLITGQDGHEHVAHELNIALKHVLELSEHSSNHNLPSSCHASARVLNEHPSLAVAVDCVS